MEVLNPLGRILDNEKSQLGFILPQSELIIISEGGLRQPFSFVTQEVVEATCQCLLAQVVYPAC